MIQLVTDHIDHIGQFTLVSAICININNQNDKRHHTKNGACLNHSKIKQYPLLQYIIETEIFGRGIVST